MNVSFTSNQGVQILKKAKEASELAHTIQDKQIPVSDTDSKIIQAKLIDASIGVDVLKKHTPIEDDAAYGHAELTQKAKVDPKLTEAPNLVEKLKSTLMELTKKMSDAVTRKDSLDGEDRTATFMVGGTIKNIQSKMYG